MPQEGLKGLRVLLSTCAQMGTNSVIDLTTVSASQMCSIPISHIATNSVRYENKAWR